MRYAIIEHGIISNIIEADKDFANQLGAVEIAEDIGIDDVYENGNFIVAEKPITPIPPVESVSLEQAIKDKTDEINIICENVITKGVDYNGNHYSLTAYDQTNIMALSELAKSGKDVPYHADGQICRFYTPAEMLGLFAEVFGYITYNTTYTNLLKHQIAEMTVIADVQAVIYGSTKLNDTYNALLNSVLEALTNETN